MTARICFIFLGGHHDSAHRKLHHGKRNFDKHFYGCIFFFGLFLFAIRGMETINLGVGEKFPPDFFPQAFFLGFFCSFMPQIMTSKAIKKGTLIGMALPIKRIFLRSLAFAILILVLLGTAAFYVSYSFEGQSISFAQAWGFKIVFAVIIAVIVTPFALRPFKES